MSECQHVWSNDDCCQHCVKCGIGKDLADLQAQIAALTARPPWRCATCRHWTVQKYLVPPYQNCAVWADQSIATPPDFGCVCWKETE